MGGPVLTLWSDMSRDPLGCGPRPSLRCYQGKVREAGLPPKLVLDPLLPTADRLLGVLVRHLVPRNAGMGRDPEDGDLVLSAQEVLADLDGRPCPVLSRPDGIRPNALNGCLRIRKDGAAMAESLVIVADPQRLVNSEDLRVEDLLVTAQMKAAPCLAPPSHPCASCPDLTTVEAGTVRPDGVPGPPRPGRLQCRALLVDEHLPGERPALAPDLELYRLTPPGARHRPEPGGERHRNFNLWDWWLLSIARRGRGKAMLGDLVRSRTALSHRMFWGPLMTYRRYEASLGR